ncbi:MAG: hypothetical protein PHV34_15810 [Verrucomicrobiae bacterium]|nr:hypothetical protein [Verrucomicrobiae bacterium]
MNSRLIELRRGNQRAWVYPEQGFQLHGFETELLGKGRVRVIYRPDGSLEPADRRYGNPILFPNPGGVCGEHGANAWEFNGCVLTMPSHGFARNLYWQMTDQREDRAAAEASSNTSGKLVFPFNHRLECVYRLEDCGLVLDAVVENTGKEAFPYAFGFHPYLRVPLGERGTVADGAVKLPPGARLESSDEWRTIRETPFEAREVRANEELARSILLTRLGVKYLELEDRANGLAARVSVEDSEGEMPVWVVWSATPESPYVCLEPWTDADNALNRGTSRWCAPGQRHKYRMTISVREI